jgi:hypothetical protein
MKTEIATTAGGVQGRFQGLMKGEANLDIHERDGKTYITESTRVTPNLQPFTFLAEKLPIVGQGLVAPMRRAAEGMLGLPLVALHAMLVDHDDAETIVSTLDRRRLNPKAGPVIVPRLGPSRFSAGHSSSWHR